VTRAILVGAAPLPAGWLRRELQRLGAKPGRDLVIGIDGGVDACLRAGRRPSFAVGDWDSLKARRALAGIPHVTLDREKDRSDLFFAIEAARFAGARGIVALGVTGGRPDHHLAALLDCARAARSHDGAIELRGPEGSYRFLSSRQGIWRASLLAASRLSLFAPLGPASGLELRGFAYSGRLERLEPSSHGLSNRVLRGPVEISCARGVVVAIIPSR
jgi:thiamine pyrophosphokinase